MKNFSQDSFFFEKEERHDNCLKKEINKSRACKDVKGNRLIELLGNPLVHTYQSFWGIWLLAAIELLGNLVVHGE